MLYCRKIVITLRVKRIYEVKNRKTALVLLDIGRV